MYWLVAAVGTGAIAWALFSRRNRGKSVRRLAPQLGLNYGRALPLGLSLKGVSFSDSFDTQSNVMCGTLEGVEAAVFDYNANHGELGYKQTVIAIKSDLQIKETSGFWKFSGISVERAGEWIIMYRAKEEVSPENLPSFINDCRNLLSSFDPTAPL